MADTQRKISQSSMEKAAKVHEDSQSLESAAPLAPRSSLLSENGDPDTNPGKARVTNPSKVVYIQYPKDQVIRPRTAPRYYSTPPKRRPNSCCRCLCLTFCLLLIFITAIVTAAGILHAVFQPRLPRYTVDSIRIRRFTTGTDSTVSSQFIVGVRARNPNKKIGVYYLDQSFVAVLYTGTELSFGELPVFYQAHKNSTSLDVFLTGNNVQVTSEKLSLLKAEQKKESIPLNLKADLPVKIEFGKLKSMKITLRVRCDLVVDRLSANVSVNITNQNCKLKL